MREGLFHSKEAEMSSIQQELGILKKLNLGIRPVIVGFLTKRPEGLERLEGTMTFCQMLKRAQEGPPFYADSDNHICEAGPFVLGSREPPKPFLTGEYGAGHQHVKEPRTMRKMYRSIPKMEKNIIHYVGFSTIDRWLFEPDVLIIVSDINQTEILLRAMSFTTGKVYSSKFTGVMGCAWIYIYPHITGELNYVPAGLGAGMKMLKVFPEGSVVTSIPFDLLPTILKNLQEMPWVLPLHQPNGEEFRLRLRRELGIDP
jgi:uncharacterized protein (DUF169 family)